MVFRLDIVLSPTDAQSTFERSWKMTLQVDTARPESGVVTGVPRILLRLEGLLVLAVAVIVYARFETGWLLFAVLFFVPDVFMLGYLKDSRWGAVGYNIGHNYLVPAALFAYGWYFDVTEISAIAVVWIGHIGFDRAVGYGLKYAVGFKSTHLSAGN
jgi:Domain of unknown function (DUF4260)